MKLTPPKKKKKKKINNAMNVSASDFTYRGILPFFKFPQKYLIVFMDDLEAWEHLGTVNWTNHCLQINNRITNIQITTKSVLKIM